VGARDWVAWQSVPTHQTGLGLELHHHIGSVGAVVGDGLRIYGFVYYHMNDAHYGGHYTSHWKVSVAMYNSRGEFISSFPTRVSWPLDLDWQPTRKVLLKNLAEWVDSVLADRF
jgi:hypothetical protein